MTESKEQAEQEISPEEEQAETHSTSELKPTVESLQEALAKSEEKAKENYDLALRTKAEAENIKRRAEKDVASAHKYALEKFVNELLPVVDSMELGLAAALEENVDISKIREGSELTLKMMFAAIEKFDIKPIDPEGEKFNPEFHQAMTMQESAEVEPNTVMNVIQKGYTLSGRLVRPAMVVVSKAATPPEDSKKIDETA
jgi:molecular chaperone GrpE